MVKGEFFCVFLKMGGITACPHTDGNDPVEEEMLVL